MPNSNQLINTKLDCHSRNYWASTIKKFESRRITHGPPSSPRPYDFFRHFPDGANMDGSVERSRPSQTLSATILFKGVHQLVALQRSC